MTEYAWPAVLRPSRLSFYLQHNTLRFVSPVTRVSNALSAAALMSSVTLSLPRFSQTN